MNHEINLTGYTATCGEPNNMLDLGTAGSYGLEKLHVTADTAWNGLTITATFTNSGSTTVAVSDGAVDVPPEATRLPTRDRVRYGMLAFKGVDANGKLRIISTPIYYKVQASAATDGSNTIDPTPDQYAQFVAEVMAEADRAEAAANRAESAGGNVTPEQIAEAVNNYLTENPVQATPIDATLTQSGQAADAKVVGDAIANIELTPGKDGADGITPTIGSNGNWYLGDTDTGKPSRGGIGPAGADGTNGKSAYQYAQEGGYTGTEAEFAAKLAEEMPDKLPNPNALTFTGAVTGSYDGSAALEVEIPSGGGGEGSHNMELLFEVQTTEEVSTILSGVNPAEYCEITMICQTVAADGTTTTHFDWIFGKQTVRLSSSLHATQRRVHLFHAIKNAEGVWTGQISRGSMSEDIGTQNTTSVNVSEADAATVFYGGIQENIGCQAYLYSGVNLATGTILKVYGRKS